MYNLEVKENGPAIDITITRALLGIAGIASILNGSAYAWLNIIVAIIFVIAAVRVKRILVSFNTRILFLLIAASFLLFIITRSLGLPLFLVVFGVFARFMTGKPLILLDNNGISIKKWYHTSIYNWSELTNVVLKDHILTMDFNNNRLVQLTIDENDYEVNELEFNQFCRGMIFAGATSV